MARIWNFLGSQLFRILSFLVGTLPWLLLSVCSWPWLPIVSYSWYRCCHSSEMIRRKKSGDFLYTAPTYSEHKLSTESAQCESSEEQAASRHLRVALGALMPIFAFLNLSALGSWMWFYRGVLSPLPYQVLAYFAVLAIISFIRLSLGRLRYGHGHEANKAIDIGLMNIFGIYLVKRGGTAQWIYPFLSAFLVWAITCCFTWCSGSTYYAVTCSPGANGTLVLDAQHCFLNNSSGNLLQSLPYLFSSLMFGYHVIKSIAGIMIKLDPVTSSAWVSTEARQQMENFRQISADKIERRSTDLEELKSELRSELRSELASMMQAALQSPSQHSSPLPAPQHSSPRSLQGRTTSPPQGGDRLLHDVTPDSKRSASPKSLDALRYRGTTCPPKRW